MHKIVLAHPGWRALAAFLDFLIAVFIGLGFFALTQTIFMNSARGKELTQSLIDYQVGSGLYYEEDGEMKVYNDYSSYTKYEEIMTNYYLVYLPSQDSALDYDVYWYNVHILGLHDDLSRFSADDLAKIQEPSKDCVLWSYPVEGGVIQHDKLGVPADNLYEGGELKVESKAALLRFYCSEETRSVYYNAMQDLFHRSYFEETYNRYTFFDLLYPLVISAPLAAFVIYLIIPLCFKNGETLCKKMLHLCLTNQYGFRIRKSQLVLRSLPAILLSAILLLFLNLIISVSIISILFFISFLLSVITPQKKAIHDYLAGTQVINERDSVFYDDLASQEEGEAAYQARMEAAEEQIKKGKEALEAEERAKAEFPKK